MINQTVQQAVKSVAKQVVKELSNYQKYYVYYSWTQSIAMTLIAAFSNFMSLPLIYECFKRKFKFVGYMCLSSAVTSFLYHLCQIYDCTLFLDFSAWHRLDNVFAVTSMSIYLVYLTGNIHNQNLLYCTLLVAILAQQKDPWNLNYTVWPIVGFGVIGIIANIYYKIGVPQYRYDQLLKGTILLSIGGYFFVKGLDQHTDYLRFNHGVWHLFLGISSYFNMNSIKPREEKQSYKIIDHSQ